MANEKKDKEPTEWNFNFVDISPVSQIQEGEKALNDPLSQILNALQQGQKSNRGLPIGVFTELKVGAGTTVFRVTKDGVWLGGENFDNATFRISMSGAGNRTCEIIGSDNTAVLSFCDKLAPNYPQRYEWQALTNGNFRLNSVYTGGSVANIIVVTPTGNVGIDVANPTYRLQMEQNSATDPIADSWGTYTCDRAHKEIVKYNPSGYLEQIANQPLYEWKRKTKDRDKAKLPKFSSFRVGIMIDDPETPDEILLINSEGKKEGIDLLAYIGYLHAALKEAIGEIKKLKDVIRE